MPEEMDTVTESVPEDDGSANPAVSDDFVGDTEAEDTRDAAAQTPEGNSTPFDPEQVDLLRTNVEDVPADQRPFFEKWQKMGRGLYKTVEERVKSENRQQTRYRGRTEISDAPRIVRAAGRARSLRAPVIRRATGYKCRKKHREGRSRRTAGDSVGTQTADGYRHKLPPAAEHQGRARRDKCRQQRP